MSSNWRKIIIIVIFGLSIQCFAAMQSIFPLCHRNDRKFKQCLKHKIQDFQSHLKYGIPEINLPPCEPLLLSRVDIDQAIGPVAFNSTYTNIQIFGGTDFIIKRLKINTKDRIKLKLYMPNLQIILDHVIKGRILILPIDEITKVWGNFTDVNAMIKIQTERYLNNKTSMLHLRNIATVIDLNIDKAEIVLKYLFNDNEVINEAINIVLKDNWKSFLAEIKPIFEKSMSKLLESIMNNLFSKYPLDVLLPP